jgi:hypothetical protein
VTRHDGLQICQGAPSGSDDPGVLTKRYWRGMATGWKNEPVIPSLLISVEQFGH